MDNHVLDAPPPASAQSTIDWDDIYSDIKDRNATLILGPDFFSQKEEDNDTGKMLTAKQLIYTELQKSNDNGILHFYPENGIFLFKSEFYKNKAQRFAAKYFSQYKADAAVLQRITEMPFRLVLNTNPDDKLVKLLRNSGRECQFDYFTCRPKDKDFAVEEPDPDYPLIYNLFGYTEDYDSLVLDFEDMFDHLKALLNNTNVPQEVRTILNKTNTFIFIGFKLENWSTQLLFRYLNMKLHGFDDSKKNYTTKATNIDENSEAFFRQQFNIKYYGAPVEFLDEVHTNYFARLAKDDEDEAAQAGTTIKDVVAYFLLNEEIEKLLNFITFRMAELSPAMADAITTIKAKYSWYNYARKRKLQKQEDLTIAWNTLKDSIRKLFEIAE